MNQSFKDYRNAYMPLLSEVFKQNVQIKPGEKTQSLANQKEIHALFPLTYGAPLAHFVPSNQAFHDSSGNPTPLHKVAVVLSGGPAPGGHNVISGLFDALKKYSPQTQLIGFLAGPGGILKNQFKILDEKLIQEYRNTGGFDIIGSGRTKLDSQEDYAQALEVCTKNQVGALVVIGGDDSNTNAAVLAEYFASQKSSIVVVGVPKTIDGDLQNEDIEISFGFDTAAKTYSNLIGNIARDALSSRKYWHFIKLMGRSASHITLECALETQPNITLISEYVEKNKFSLDQIVEEIVQSIVARSQKGENFGIVLIPEGILEFIPSFKDLIEEINHLLVETSEISEDKAAFSLPGILKKLSPESGSIFASLAPPIQSQLLLERDPHGNISLSQIETEKILISLIETRLFELKKEGTYSGKFSALTHFFGYEGRCAYPSLFDADYCYNLGYTAFFLIQNHLNGYMACVKNLHLPAQQWIPMGVPISMFFNIEKRHGKNKAVIQKTLVDLNQASFRFFLQQSKNWAIESDYRFPEPIQFDQTQFARRITETVRLKLGAL